MSLSLFKLSVRSKGLAREEKFIVGEEVAGKEKANPSEGLFEEDSGRSFGFSSVDDLLNTKQKKTL